MIRFAQAMVSLHFGIRAVATIFRLQDSHKKKAVENPNRLAIFLR